jgi:hypothetical protein
MGALLLLLVVTNVAAMAVIGWLLLRPGVHEPDPLLMCAVDGTTPPAGAVGTRRVITFEILNAVELASERGRVVSLAGALAPGLLKRVVIDQVVRRMKRDLKAQGVIADVRLHVIRPEPQPRPAPVPAGARRPAPAGPVYIDEVRRLELDDDSIGL